MNAQVAKLCMAVTMVALAAGCNHFTSPGPGAVVQELNQDLDHGHLQQAARLIAFSSANEEAEFKNITAKLVPTFTTAQRDDRFTVTAVKEYGDSATVTYHDDLNPSKMLQAHLRKTKQGWKVVLHGVSSGW